MGNTSESKTYNEKAGKLCSNKSPKTISRYSVSERGHTVHVAVFGGSDSVCLLHALAALRPRWNLRLHILHLDHNLRGEESCADAEFVRGGSRASSSGFQSPWARRIPPNPAATWSRRLAMRGARSSGKPSPPAR